MVTPQSRRFDARRELFATVQAFVEQFCAGAGVDHRARAALTLIVEELFANSVQHGYGAVGECAPEWPVWLTLAVTGDRIDAAYEDAGPAYNPFEKISAPDYSGPAETWRVGGLGVVLVAGHASNLGYEHKCGRNSIRFTVPMNDASG